MQKFLTPAEQARCQRYRQQDDRDRYLGGRALAKLAAARFCQISWQEVSVILHASGKPGISLESANIVPPSISISHAGDLVAVAISFDGDIGIDVELLHDDVNIADLAKVVCSASEIAEIYRATDKTLAQRFYAFWVLKEACLKATGEGLTVDARQLIFSIDAGLQVNLLQGPDGGQHHSWDFFLRQYDDRHMMALATRLRKKLTGNHRQRHSHEALKPMPVFVDVLPILETCCN